MRLPRGHANFDARAAPDRTDMRIRAQHQASICSNQADIASEATFKRSTIVYSNLFKLRRCVYTRLNAANNGFLQPRKAWLAHVLQQRFRLPSGSNFGQRKI